MIIAGIVEIVFASRSFDFSLFAIHLPLGVIVVSFRWRDVVVRMVGER